MSSSRQSEIMRGFSSSAAPEPTGAELAKRVAALEEKLAGG